MNANQTNQSDISEQILFPIRKAAHQAGWNAVYDKERNELIFRLPLFPDFNYQEVVPFCACPGCSACDILPTLEAELREILAALKATTNVKVGLVLAHLCNSLSNLYGALSSEAGQIRPGFEHLSGLPAKS